MKRIERQQFEEKVNNLRTDWDEMYKLLVLLETFMENKLNETKKLKDTLMELMKK